MGYCLNKLQANHVFEKLAQDYILFAPKLFRGGAIYSDTDYIRYGEIESIDEIVWYQKSHYSFKEFLLPLSQTLFYFTEDKVKEADIPQKGVIIFLRSCDLHAVKRLDEIYLKNGFEDYYYKRLREKVKFVLMDCQQSFEDCFCVSMGTNQCEAYDLSITLKEDGVYLDNKTPLWDEIFKEYSEKIVEVKPQYVTENEVKVKVPEDVSLDIVHSPLWEEYHTRCIGCGRCNFVCPTCTCFTMQDIFYKENGKIGERRRVMASCMVDGFTEVAGGGGYRIKKGERMRFKVLHKIYDYKKRSGHHMCVGCGRCDTICPEYISFSNSINKLEQAMKEVSTNE